MKQLFLLLIIFSIIPSINANPAVTQPVQVPAQPQQQIPVSIAAAPANQQNVEAIVPILATLVSFIKIMLNPHDATNVTTNAAQMLDGIVQTVGIITREHEKFYAEKARRVIALNQFARMMKEYAQTKAQQV